MNSLINSDGDSESIADHTGELDLNLSESRDPLEDLSEGNLKEKGI